MDLSYPFRLYPLNSRNIVTDYISSRYVSEIIKLNDKLNNLDVKNTTVILIIGSLIDDMTDYQYSENQQYQHLPRFVHNYVINNSNKIKIICVAPGNGRNDDEIDSRFVNLTKSEYEWTKKTNNEYLSKKYPQLSYSFYNTLFPEFIDSDFVKNKNAYLYKNGITEHKIPRLYYKNKHFQKMYTIQHETESNIYLKIKENVAIGQFSELGNNLPSETDKLFVNDFHNTINNLVKKLKANSGSLLILNYAVFRDNWISTQTFYFFKTLYDNFKEQRWTNVKLLHYKFEDNSSELYDDINNKNIYSYEDNTIEFKIARNSRIQINNVELYHKKTKETKETKETIYINNNILFKLIDVEDDGNCMFNAVLHQFKDIPISVKNARKLIIAQILSEDNIQVLLKEEIYTRTEYDDLITRKGIDYVFDLHLYFMKEGPECKNSENIREYYDLPLDVYYGGNYELSILSKLLKINIRIINIDNNIIEFLPSYNTAYDDIYIKYDGDHYNIATLDPDHKFECYFINENMISFTDIKHEYHMRVNKFISSKIKNGSKNNNTITQYI